MHKIEYPCSKERFFFKTFSFSWAYYFPILLISNCSRLGIRSKYLHKQRPELQFKPVNSSQQRAKGQHRGEQRHVLAADTDTQIQIHRTWGLKTHRRRRRQQARAPIPNPKPERRFMNSGTKGRQEMSNSKGKTKKKNTKKDPKMCNCWAISYDRGRVNNPERFL